MSTSESPQFKPNQQELSREVTTAESGRIKEVLAQIREILNPLGIADLGKITQEEYRKLDPDIRDQLTRLSERLESLVSGEQLIPKEVLEQMEEAKEIFGQDFLGPEEIRQAFNLEDDYEIEVPLIPFSREKLERAKELDQFLILRIPITMAEINERLGGRFKDGKNLFQDYNPDTKEFVRWFKDLEKDFYESESARKGWALVGKQSIADKQERNYIDMIWKIYTYLNYQLFQHRPIPEVYKQAFSEFESKAAGISNLLNNPNDEAKLEEAARELEQLSIVKLTCRLPVEFVFDQTCYFQVNDERLAPLGYWTYSRYKNKNFLNVHQSTRMGFTFSDVPTKNKFRSDILLSRIQ